MNADKTFDYIVIGSGFGGSVSAMRLAEKGYSVAVLEKGKRWAAEIRIALRELGPKPEPGARWRINLYRCDYANKTFLAFNPVLTGSFHTPERFGILQFVEK